MSEKGFLDYVPLQFLNFDVVAIILIVGLLASIIAFYCFAAEVKIKKDEEIKIKKPKKTRKQKAKDKEKLFIEEDDFATEEVLEKYEEQTKTEETLTHENNSVQEKIDLDDMNLEDINIEDIDLTEIDKNILKDDKESSDVLNVDLSDEDELFLAELMKTLDSDKEEINEIKHDVTLNNNNTNTETISDKMLEKKKEEEKIQVEAEETNFELSLKEKMKMYAENLKKDEINNGNEEDKDEV